MGIKGKKLQVKDLSANPHNPRKISDAKLKQLAKSMEEYGDISGIVFNRRTGNLVGGNQRSKDLDETSKVKITKTYPVPSRTGTIAIGYIDHQGERFSYREVDWSLEKETGAMLAANKNAGEWDKDILNETLKSLSSFDLDFDLELTMFDEDELSQFKLKDEEPEPYTEGEDEDAKDREKSPSKLVHECPRCGYEFR